MALYGQGARRWTMTERGRAQLARSARELHIGPSRVQWDGQSLLIDIDEISVPWPRRVRGRVRVHPQGLCRYVAALDAAGRHRWGPIAPCARIEVDFERPDLHWRGHAYFDANEGDEPVDHGFRGWDWSRALLADGSTAVVYDVRPRGGRGTGSPRVIAQRFAQDGSSSPFDPPAHFALPRSKWGLRRTTRSDAATPARVQQTFEDTPFYARSVVESSLQGEPVTAVHETLDVPRLTALPVQFMLPCRMPRRT